MSVAWGTPDATGIAVGLQVAPSTTGPLTYQVAIANRSSEPRNVVLFATLDGRIRTRIVAKQGNTEQSHPAILPARPVATNYSIKVDLAPGEVVLRDGAPARFELTGDAKVHVVLGGVTAHPEEIKSGEVTLKLPA